MNKRSFTLMAMIVGLVAFGCAHRSGGGATSSAASNKPRPVPRTVIAVSEITDDGVAGESGRDDLLIAEGGATQAIVVVSPEAQKAGEGKTASWERRAAQDLVNYIELMSGAKPALADTPEAIAAALKSKAPVLIVGSEAIKAQPKLRDALAKAAKKNPEIVADAIVVRREGNRVYLAGINDDSHYYAVSHLLHAWGCRWYIPTEIGECVPSLPTLKIGKIDDAYGPFFESRHYWISWIGDTTGALEFKRRNFMNDFFVSCGHALAAHVGEVVPEGGSHFNIPITDPRTAKAIAKSISEAYVKGPSVSIGMEDGAYTSDYTNDKEQQANLYDKYFLTAVLTDPFMQLNNEIARELKRMHPESNTKLGFLSYVNITIPPQREIKAEKSLVTYLAPIDIDPTHGMDDPRSPPRQEYREMMYRWSEVMEGRVVIYDYDQGMLVWRDIPNPSHMAFRQDVKHYRDAGILGVGTESRNAIGTIFTNLFFRGQLMWNPDADVDAMLAEFYPRFYGPAAEPMSRYWGTIYQAWEDTIAQEHEFFVAPAVYTPEVMAVLDKALAEAEAIVKPLAGKADLTRQEKQVVERMKMINLMHGVLSNYMQMTFAAAGEVDYKKAVAFGEKGLAAREALTAMNGTFTTAKLEGGDAWWPGEVEMYRNLAALTDGSKGTLITKLPLEWAFRRDPNDTGLPMGFAYKSPDLTHWNANKSSYTLETRKDYPTTEWETLRTDIYAQAQGVMHPDWQSFTGFMWYHTPVELKADQTQGKVHVMFPGLFSEAWLYVNGHLVAHREQKHMWWINDYKFHWDVDLSGKLKPGKNDIVVRVHNTHHNGGMFRRPFLYHAK